ncbi:MAG: hypothetical protein LLG08_01425 [Actinomycetia bacterium]|nr:hypothetical protein [Actinomycetes bacterium]
MRAEYAPDTASSLESVCEASKEVALRVHASGSSPVVSLSKEPFSMNENGWAEFASSRRTLSNEAPPVSFVKHCTRTFAVSVEGR